MHVDPASEISSVYENKMQNVNETHFSRLFYKLHLYSFDGSVAIIRPSQDP